MILGFRCADTQTLFEMGKSRRFAGIAAVANRKLGQLEAAYELRDLGSPPGNRLKALKGNRGRAAQHPDQRPVPHLPRVERSARRAGRDSGLSLKRYWQC